MTVLRRLGLRGGLAAALALALLASGAVPWAAAQSAPAAPGSVNANGNAEWREASVGALAAPTAPTGLAVSNWVLRWNAPSNTGNAAIDRYEVECRRGVNKGTVHSTTGATSVTLTHSWCKQYSFHGNHARVRARNAGNLYGAWSGWLRLQ